jgi:hypothetical protein
MKEGQRKGQFVRNSIAIQELSDEGPGTVTYHWDLTDNVPGAFFHPDSFHDPDWFWPGTGVTINGKTYVFMTRVLKGEGNDAFGFTNAGCVLFVIQNPDAAPDDWNIKKIEMGLGDHHYNINSGCLVEGDYLYFLGYDDGPEKKAFERVAILSRIPIEKLNTESPGTSLEFWSKGEQWLTTQDKLAPLYKPGATESSLYYDSHLKRYIATTVGAFSTDYYIFNAEKLTGPWSEKQKIYDIPDLKQEVPQHAYAGRIHPMLSRNPGELILTYVVNTSDFWSMFGNSKIYYPRFIRVRLKVPGEQE